MSAKKCLSQLPAGWSILSERMREPEDTPLASEMWSDLKSEHKRANHFGAGRVVVRTDTGDVFMALRVTASKTKKGSDWWVRPPLWGERICIIDKGEK
jgi:hypothetical protein